MRKIILISSAIVQKCMYDVGVRESTLISVRTCTPQPHCLDPSPPPNTPLDDVNHRLAWLNTYPLVENIIQKQYNIPTMVYNDILYTVLPHTNAKLTLIPVIAT